MELFLERIGVCVFFLFCVEILLLMFESFFCNGDFFVFKSERNLLRLYRERFLLEFWCGNSCGFEEFFLLWFGLVGFNGLVVLVEFDFDLFLLDLDDVDDMLDNCFFKGDLFVFKMFKNLWRL